MVGSFVLGVFSVVALAWNLDARYTPLAAVGFCGSLTTMSSFARETNYLLDGGYYGLVALNILANVCLSIAAVAGGRGLTGALLKG